ncbi:MAG: PHB depolymerase family esterase [Caulobacteraceae bacterium]
MGETVAMLARAGRQANAAFGSASGSGRFDETVSFGKNPGGLRMFSHAPDGLQARAPLVVVLHGCAQAAQGHAAAGGWVELADRLGFVVLAPEQATANNLNRCFNWFSPDDIGRGKGEAASIAEMIDEAVRVHDLDPEQVYVTGLSAGGAMAAVMLAAYPERFAGGAIIAGLPYGVAHNLHEAMRVMNTADGRTPSELGDLVQRAAPNSPRRPLRLSIWHGDADTVVSPSNARDLAAQWLAVSGLDDAPVSRDELPGRSRATWGSASPKAAAVELNLVHGLGHGTPLSTGGEDGIGSTAPFMLEAGISSTLDIARFWGLKPSPAYRRQEQAATKASAGNASATATPADVAAQVLGAIEKHVPEEVQDVIARALRTAGLTR